MAAQREWKMMLKMTRTEAAAMMSAEMVGGSSLNATAKADGLKKTHVHTKNKCKSKVHGREEGSGSVDDKMERSLHR